ncbi:lipocalin-like domain-containing protein [Mycolicibacterium sp. P1-18]|uniref:lipocalin-like domain-containing protein n=1 Tax=Mycolicibacterium sp. P1-18 TaxID=2024615 RepID=UPI0011F32DA6|nr:lipocalin-like domain-containing protein [Mycolicibacterium sp. P1-18]KAA0097963.1 lipocalin-like domain-containing protein [Mycolicibacterium sp. P1-18]
MTTEDLRASIVGAWTLITYESTAVDGTSVTYPLGSDARGVIMYTADGYMSAQIMRSGRKRFAGSDAHAASEAELAWAAEGYLSYAGPYTVLDGGLIAHHVDVSLLPNWVGGTQYRAARLNDSHLQLAPSEPIQLDGELRNARLVWRRVAPFTGDANLPS